MFNLFEIDGNSEFEQRFVMNWAPRADFRSHDEGFFLQYCISVSNQKRSLLPSTERKLGMPPVMYATAYGALFGRTPLVAEQRILIHGGSGAVGSMAVQLAKSVGAYAIATASTHNLSWVQELGANEVIDYKKQKFEDVVSNIDFVLDTVGGRNKRALLVHIERSWRNGNTGAATP